jgi:hypothetical protein
MDDEQSNYIRVRSAYVNFFFNQCKTPEKFDLRNKFPFYLKSDFKVTYENLGIDTESPFWSYFGANLHSKGANLENKFINLSFMFDMTTQKAEKLIEDFDKIKITVQFEQNLDLTRKMAFYDKVKHFYLPKYLYINFSNQRQLIKNVGFDFESPYIMEFTSFDIFSKVIQSIQKILCEDINKCTTMNDIRHSINKNERMAFNFSFYNPLDNSANNYRVVFNLYELYYYRDKDPEKNIKYNFKYRSKDDYTTHKNIENYLGLLFLRKVKLIMCYKESTQNFSLVLMDPNGPSRLRGFMYLWIFLLSLVLSLLCLCKVNLDVKNRSSVNYQTFLTNN